MHLSEGPGVLLTLRGGKAVELLARNWSRAWHCLCILAITERGWRLLSTIHMCEGTEANMGCFYYGCMGNTLDTEA